MRLRKIECFSVSSDTTYPAWEVRLFGDRICLRMWRRPLLAPFWSTRYTILNAGALGFCFSLMRVYRPTEDADA